MNILFIDNFDSFSFNLVHDFRARGARVHVWRNDIAAGRALELALALPAPALAVLSPGPGAPAEAGCCVEFIRRAAGRLPLFGVCLGHQAMVEACGGTVGRAGEPVHGKSSWIDHDGEGIFAGLERPLMVGRYHSLAAERLPGELAVTARAGSVVMAVAHRRHAMVGVQFHPESILTPQGGRLLDNVLRWAASRQAEFLWPPGPGKEAAGAGIQPLHC